MCLGLVYLNFVVVVFLNLLQTEIGVLITNLCHLWPMRQAQQLELVPGF
jgi:hypothetical protein